jgi:hypothetical protein
MRTFVTAPAVVCSLLVLLASTRAEDGTRAVIEKAIKAHGGTEKLDRQKTFRPRALHPAPQSDETDR